jgi:hypothetical protein
VSDNLEIKRLEPEDWEILREVRLRALANAPTAFASSLQQEQRWSPVEWQPVGGRIRAQDGSAASPGDDGCVGQSVSRWDGYRLFRR